MLDLNAQERKDSEPDLSSDNGSRSDGASNESADIATYYSWSGFKVVPVPRGQKGPRIEGWPEGIPLNWWKESDRSGYGLALLHSLSDTCAIDLDALAESRTALASIGVDVDKLLNAQGSVQISSGRDNRAKLIYKVPSELRDQLSLKKLEWLKPDAKSATGTYTILELRAGRAVADMLPPSIHPKTKKPYTWQINGKELLLEKLEHYTTLYESIPELPSELAELWLAWPVAEQRMKDADPNREEPAPKPDLTGELRKSRRRARHMKAIDAFNERYTCEHWLERHGYEQISADRWRKPDSESSAGVSTKYAGLVTSFHAGCPLFGKAHSSFGVFTILEHGGDFEAALKDARDKLGLKVQTIPKSQRNDEPEIDPETAEPIPLMGRLEAPQPFPYDALGPTLAPLAKLMDEAIEAPDGVIGLTLLTAASLAVQGLGNFRSGVLPGPIGLFAMVVAESGERKSGVFDMALRPLREWEREQRAKFLGTRSEWKDAKERYDIVYSEAKKAAQKAAQKALQAQSTTGAGDSGAKPDKDPQAIVSEILEQVGEPPKKPREVWLTIEEPTTEKLEEELLNGHPSRGIFSDEGGRFFGGHSMRAETRDRSITVLSALWSSGKVERARVTAGETRRGFGKRLSMLLMLQPNYARRILADPELLGQGFLARFLICWPKGRAGSRNTDQLNKLIWERSEYRNYEHKLRAALNAPLPYGDEEGELSPPELTFSAAALPERDRLADLYEHEQRAGDFLLEGAEAGKYSDEATKPYASKAMEQIGRIAAVLTLIEDVTAREVGLTATRNAGELLDYLATEYSRLFGAQGELPQTISDAIKLMEWASNHNHKVLYSTLIMQRGPKPMRLFKERVQAALKVLEDHYLAYPFRPSEDLRIDGALRAQAWHIKLEQWRAQQLQERLEEASGSQRTKS